MFVKRMPSKRENIIDLFLRARKHHCFLPGCFFVEAFPPNKHYCEIGSTKDRLSWDFRQPTEDGESNRLSRRWSWSHLAGIVGILGTGVCPVPNCGHGMNISSSVRLICWVTWRDLLELLDRRQSGDVSFLSLRKPCLRRIIVRDWWEWQPL